jgi:hypothetical protein
MGWAGGTEVFDGALNVFLKYVPEDEIDSALIAWYDVVREGDWDTVSESDYYDMLRPALVKAGEIEDEELYG